MWVVGPALVIVIGLVGWWLWDRRYRGASGAESTFRPTDEVFRDPASGRWTRVYVDPATGRRQYREEEPPRGPGREDGE
jgi:hypothetical protein